MTRHANIEDPIEAAGIDPNVAHRAAVTLADHATGRDELARWLDMLGLNGRDIRLSERAARRLA